MNKQMLDAIQDDAMLIHVSDEDAAKILGEKLPVMEVEELTEDEVYYQEMT